MCCYWNRRKAPFPDNQAFRMPETASTELQLPDSQVAQVPKGQVAPSPYDRILITRPSPIIQAQQVQGPGIVVPGASKKYRIYIPFISKRSGYLYSIYIQQIEVTLFNLRDFHKSHSLKIVLKVK